MTIVRALILQIGVCVCLGQSKAQLVPATKVEAPIRNTFVLSNDEKATGCFAPTRDFAARIVKVDCSAAMPWSDRSKTVRIFCVVYPNERLRIALVESRFRILQRCEVDKLIY